MTGTPEWTGGRFVYTPGSQPNTYFVLISSGAAEGRSYLITGNGTATLSLDLEGDSLSSVQAGDALKIIPYWTLGTLFPALATGVSFTPTTVIASPQTTVALFLRPTAGINPVPTRSFFFYSGAWRETGQNVAVSRDDQVVGFGSPMRVRNAGPGGALSTAGAVVMQKVALPIATEAGTQHDNLLALPRPSALTLSASGLISSGAFLPSANALDRADLLMVTDQTAPGMNRAASAYYIYYNSGWRKLGQPLSADFGSDVIFDPAKSVTIRTASSPEAVKRYWVNAAPY